MKKTSAYLKRAFIILNNLALIVSPIMIIWGDSLFWAKVLATVFVFAGISLLFQKKDKETIKDDPKEKNSPGKKSRFQARLEEAMMKKNDS